MTVKYHLQISFFLFLLPFSAFTQEVKKSTADKYYDNYSYDLAAQHYESVKDADTETLRKLGNCYYNLKNFEKAEAVYAKVIKGHDSKPEDIYKYASILHINKKYIEAKSWMSRYGELEQKDTRVHQYFAQDDHVKTILENKIDVSISNLKMNSSHQDFPTGYYGKNVVYTSSRPASPMITRVWNRNNLPFLDIHIAQTDANGEFIKSSPFNGNVNSKLHEGSATVSWDGKVVFFTRNHDTSAADGSKRLKLYYLLHDGEKLSDEKPFPYNNIEYSLGQPCLSKDGTELYFVSDMPGGSGGTDIYYSSLKGENWTAPINLGNSINTEGNEMFPFFHENGTLFFSSNGHPGVGGLDIFYTLKKGPKWGKVYNAGVPLNSSKDDFALILDPAGTAGYFSSDREGGKGDDDIYRIKVNSPFMKRSYTIKGHVFNKAKESLLTGATVVVKDEAGTIIKELKTDGQGYYDFEGELNKNYILEASNPNFKNLIIKVDDLSKDRTEDFYLEIPSLSLNGKVIDAESKSPIKDVIIKIIRKQREDTYVINTDAEGNFVQNLGRRNPGEQLEYTLEFSKNGYVTKTLIASFKTPEEKEFLTINDRSTKDIALRKIGESADLGESLGLKSLMFGENKATITKEMQPELDRIVKYLNENPSIEIEIGSYTNCKGTDAANLTLSNNRANAIAKYIKPKIKFPVRVRSKGYGESNLKIKCGCDPYDYPSCSPEEHKENTRVEFKILSR